MGPRGPPNRPVEYFEKPGGPSLGVFVGEVRADCNDDWAGDDHMEDESKVMMIMMAMMVMMVERVFGWKCGKSRQEVEGVEAKTLQGGFHAIQYTYTLEYTW